MFICYFVCLFSLCAGDLSLLFTPLVDSLASFREDEEGESLIEHSCGHWVLKRLIAADSNWLTTHGQGVVSLRYRATCAAHS